MLPADKQEELVRLTERVATLEKQLESWLGTKGQSPCRVERLVIETLTAEKVEINLEAIDISELSGILNIGQSYNSTINRQAPPQVNHEKFSTPSRKYVKPQCSPQIKINYANLFGQAERRK